MNIDYINTIVFSIILLLVTTPLLPPKWYYLNESFKDAEGNYLKRKKVSLIRYYLQEFSMLLQDTVVSIAVNLSLSGTATFLIFIIVFTELYYNHSISYQAAFLVVISIIAIYFEKMLEKAEYIEFFKIFKYKCKNKD